MPQQDAIWNHFQTIGTEVFAGAGPRLRRLLSLIPSHGPRTSVLNIGVGDASFETLAHEKGFDVHCLDPGEAAIEAVRQRLGLGDKAVVGRAESLPFDSGRFDAVVASEVLEHLDDGALAAAVLEIRRVLAPGGLFLGTVPADEDLRGQFTVCPCCGHGFHRWGHRQSFSSARLSEVLGAAFPAVSIRAEMFVAWNRLNWVGRLASALKLALLRLGRHGSGETLLFMARKPAPHEKTA